MIIYNKRWLMYLLLWIALVTFVSTASGENATPYYPSTGSTVFKDGSVTIDISNAESGYIMVKHAVTNKRLKVIISHLLEQNRYDLKGDDIYETFPLAYGNGSYSVTVYEQVENAQPNTYKKVFEYYISVEMPNESTAFLYPNQYVWYTPFSWAVAKSTEICDGITNDIEKVENVVDFVRKQVRYDYIKAFSLQKTYIPSVDETLKDGTGICFDYAALTACMLRVQGIPTQLVVGKLFTTNLPSAHAWNKVQIDGTWLMIDPTYGITRYAQAQYVEQHTY